MRIDSYLVEINLFDSRTKAKQAILRGEVFVDGKVIDKPSFEILEGGNPNIEYIYQSKFVSLGGYKLDKALKDFDLSVNNFIVADIGSSTGGFSDCLLQNGVKKIFAVDLNDGLLHEKLKGDFRVKSLIKNARNLTTEDFEEKLDLLVADLSFISATMVLPVFSSILERGKLMILLVKPQFETENKIKFKNGIIKDRKIQEDALKKVVDCAEKNRFKFIEKTVAPIVDGKNLEFLVLFEKI